MTPVPAGSPPPPPRGQALPTSGPPPGHADRYPKLQVRVSPELAAMIERSARRRGVSVSAWFRQRAEEFFVPPAAVVSDPLLPDALELRSGLEAQIRDGLLENLRTADPELYDAMDKVQHPSSFVDLQPDEGTGEIRYKLVHLVGTDGMCAGGCDPDTDVTCSVGPDDPRRTGKRKRR